MAKILIVDDEPRIRDLIRAHLEHEGFSCEEAGDGGAALAALSGGDVDLVILDIMMPFVDGMTCLKEMRSRKITTPVIMLTARGGGLVIDQASHSVKVDGQEASLTPKEFDLLVFLATNRGIALSRERILQKVWNYDYFGEDRTVDTHIKMLRSHLGRYRDAIVTVWGIGYKFDPDAVK